MPRGDGTGPAGMGSMTGRAAGYCAGYSVPGFANPIGGRYSGISRGTFGGRGGGGRGYRNRYYATGLPGWYRYNTGMPVWGGISAQPVYPYTGPYTGPAVTPDQEKEMLREQADVLRQQLEDIQARVEVLEREPEKKEK